MLKNIPVTTVPIKIVLGSFPDGLYRISFLINNPLLSEYTLSISTSNSTKDYVVIHSDKQKDSFYTQFIHNCGKGNNPLTITVNQNEKYPVFLSIINRPAVVNKSIFHNATNEKLYSANRFNLFFKENVNNSFREYRPVDAYTQLLNEIVKIQTDIQNTSTPKLPSGFYELLDLKNAKEQLDYVVRTKIHLQTHGNILTRPLKKMIKHLFTFSYKILAKNPLLKNYIAKIYRNYVNMNILSERTLS